MKRVNLLNAALLFVGAAAITMATIIAIDAIKNGKPLIPLGK